MNEIKLTKKTGHTLLTELDGHLERINAEADERQQAVNTRLAELEAEKHALNSVRTKVAAVRPA